MLKTVKTLTTGYAYCSTRKAPREPETIVIGQDEIDNAAFQCTDSIDGVPMNRFRAPNGKYYWQLLHCAGERQLQQARYDESDVEQSSSWDGRISVDSDSDYVDKPLWFHERGLMQTATGYGRRLKCSRCLWFNGRLHRVYVCCFSNSGTAYIESKGRKIIVD